jgi:hypothetical protein
VATPNWDESKHPRHPAGAPASQGGEFAPKDGTPNWGDLNREVVDVGGDQWNRETAERLEREYQSAKEKIEELVEEMEGKEVEEFIQEPKSWDELDETFKQETEDAWFSDNLHAFKESEEENFYNSGEAKRIATSDIIKTIESEGFKEYVETTGEDSPVAKIRKYYEEELGKTIPFTDEQIEGALVVGADPYKSDYDFRVLIDDAKLGAPEGFDPSPTLPGVEPENPADRLTKKMREDITSEVDSFLTDQAQTDAENMDPPDYLDDMAKDAMAEYWSGMSDWEKFEYAEQVHGTLSEHADAGATIPRTFTVPETLDPLEHGGQDSSEYKATKVFMQAASVERAAQIMLERKTLIGQDQTIEKAREAARKLDQKLWTEWKGSSTSEGGIILQAAAASELGGRHSRHTKMGRYGPDLVNEAVRLADAEYDSYGGWEGVKAYVRGKWEVAQYALEKSGDDTVQVYRSVTLNVPSPSKGGPHLRDDLKLDRNGLASTSVDASIANNWNGPNRTVLRIEAPRTAVLSVPAYGGNYQEEREVVLAGTAWKGWDAWFQKAPSFDAVPLGTQKAEAVQ